MGYALDLSLHVRGLHGSTDAGLCTAHYAAVSHLDMISFGNRTMIDILRSLDE